MSLQQPSLRAFGGPAQAIAANRLERGPRRMILQLAAFTSLAALSGATAVIVIHRIQTPEMSVFETSALPGESQSRAAAAALVRGTLLRLDDANRSGNYDVFREMAAPGFRSINSSTDLSRIFGWLRNERIAFDTADRVIETTLRAQPVEPNGMLRFTGQFAAQRQLLNYDLIYQDVGGEWRLFGVAVFKG